MDWEDIKIYPEWIQDLWKYIIVLVILCVISKLVYDWKENRRLKKEFAAYQQRRKDEEQEELTSR